GPQSPSDPCPSIRDQFSRIGKHETSHIGLRAVEEVKANAGPAAFWVEPPKPFDKMLLLHFHHDPKGRECGNLTANMPTGAALARGLQSWPAWFPLAIPRSLAFRG